MIKMTISMDDWMKALSHISDADQLRATVKGSLYGGIMVGGAAMIASLILGPFGILIGGILGSILAYRKMQGTFKPLSDVIKDLSAEQRGKLFAELSSIREKVTVDDYVELILLLQGKGGLVLKREVLNVLKGFVMSNLNMQLT